jgi:hypothetical protein
MIPTAAEFSDRINARESKDIGALSDSTEAIAN